MWKGLPSDWIGVENEHRKMANVRQEKWVKNRKKWPNIKAERERKNQKRDIGADKDMEQTEEKDEDHEKDFLQF